jgi:hypothetical protein
VFTVRQQVSNPLLNFGTTIHGSKSQFSFLGNGNDNQEVYEYNDGISVEQDMFPDDCQIAKCRDEF